VGHQAKSKLWGVGPCEEKRPGARGGVLEEGEKNLGVLNGPKGNPYLKLQLSEVIQLNSLGKGKEKPGQIRLRYQ